ncbi:MAG TPA: FUSC family protein [Bryobacteraceae bacterium]|nr:FUSC family protein [Bryobacteraceae bacterium]
MKFWQGILRFQAEKISPWIAFRNTLGVALPLAAGALRGDLAPALIAAIGALNVSYSDSHEPYVERARRMLAACALVGLAVFAGAICGDHHLLAVPVTGAWAFATGMLVALSTTAADLGIMSLVTLVVFTARPLPPESAAFSGLLALSGGLLQTVLALAFWPIRRYVPERRALAALYAELARTAVAGVDSHQAPPASAQSTQAQAALAPLAGDYSIEGERYRSLLSQAERIRLGVFALSRLRGQDPRDAILERYREITARALRAVGDVLLAGKSASPAPAELEALETLAEELRSAAGAAPDARRQVDALNGQLRAAFELAAHATAAGELAFAREETRRPWRLRLAGTFATLRANLSLQSSAFRHAIRLAVCVTIGDAVGRSFELHRSYWLPMTVAIVLKPDFASTFSRGVLRLAGTFAGLVFATALYHVLPATALAQIAAIAALMFVLRCWGPANYGIFVTAVTGIIVLLIAMAGVSPRDAVIARGWNTGAGGAIALLAYWLWPTRERVLIRVEMANMLDAYRDYFRAIRDSYTQPDVAFEAPLDRTRAAARRARSNLEASVDRLRAEPGTIVQTMTALTAMMASSHRLIHAIMALEAGLRSSQAAPARQAFRRFANDVELTLHSLAAALRGSPLARADLPDLREDHHALAHSGDPATERYALVNAETDRLTNSLNTLAEQLLPWLEPGASGYFG